MKPRIGYRLRQTWQRMTGSLSRADWEAVENTLNPGEMELFRALSHGDQIHSLHVFRTLQARDVTEKDLLAAALLHDVGKAAHRLRVWERGAVVILGKLLPEAVKAWGEGQPQGWRRPLVVARQHPYWGAQLAEQAGSSPLTVWLIRHHDRPLPAVEGEPGWMRYLEKLQQADNQN